MNTFSSVLSAAPSQLLEAVTKTYQKARFQVQNPFPPLPGSLFSVVPQEGGSEIPVNCHFSDEENATLPLSVINESSIKGHLVTNTAFGEKEWEKAKEKNITLIKFNELEQTLTGGVKTAEIPATPTAAATPPPAENPFVPPPKAAEPSPAPKTEEPSSFPPLTSMEHSIGDKPESSPPVPRESKEFPPPLDDFAAPASTETPPSPFAEPSEPTSEKEDSNEEPPPFLEELASEPTPPPSEEKLPVPKEKGKATKQKVKKVKAKKEKPKKVPAQKGNGKVPLWAKIVITLCAISGGISYLAVASAILLPIVAASKLQNSDFTLVAPPQTASVSTTLPDPGFPKAVVTPEPTPPTKLTFPPAPAKLEEPAETPSEPKEEPAFPVEFPDSTPTPVLESTPEPEPEPAPASLPEPREEPVETIIVEEPKPVSIPEPSPMRSELETQLANSAISFNKRQFWSNLPEDGWSKIMDELSNKVDSAGDQASESYHRTLRALLAYARGDLILMSEDIVLLAGELDPAALEEVRISKDEFLGDVEKVLGKDRVRFLP